jgi:hypothetical protein
MPETSVHVYCQAMWENKYKRNYAQLCDYFIALLYKFFFFCNECLGLSKDPMRLLRSICNWYLQEDYTYSRIYGVIAPPHLLPKYVPNRLILRKIAYQTILQGFNATLANDAGKRTFISYNMYIGHYRIL